MKATLKQRRGPCIGCDSYSCYKKNCEESMRLKTQNGNGRTAHATPGFASLLRNHADSPAVEHPLWPLFCLVVDTLDEACVKDNTCLILGTTRDRKSHSATIKLDGNTATAYGTDMAEFLAAVEEMYQAG